MPAAAPGVRDTTSGAAAPRSSDSMPILALGRRETATTIASRGRDHGLRILAAPIRHLDQGDLRALDVAARRLAAGDHDACA